MIPGSKYVFYGKETDFTLKIFAIRGRDLLIYQYKFMNALKWYRNLKRYKSAAKFNDSHSYRNIDETRELISFAFDPRDMLFGLYRLASTLFHWSLQIGIVLDEILDLIASVSEGLGSDSVSS